MGHPAMRSDGPDNTPHHGGRQAPGSRTPPAPVAVDRARLWPFGSPSASSAFGGLHLSIEPERLRTTSLSEQIDAAWAGMQDENPRLYDGPILAVNSIDPASRTLACRREQYKSLCVGDTVDTDVRHIGVNGVVLGRDTDGVEHVLLGRRGTQTRVYGGLWELAPAGGLDAPPEQTTSLDERDIVAQLVVEAEEELGLRVDPAWCSIDALVRDDDAGRHDNIVVTVRLPEPIRPTHPPCLREHWEYLDVVWLAHPDAAAWVARDTDAIIPPTVATLRWMGWA